MICPVSSASEMECAGTVRPRSGCCPRTSARARHAAAVQLDHRLVEDAQLAALDRAVQGVLRVQSLDRAVAHDLVEQLVARLAALLGPVHRRVGVANQRLRPRVARRGHGDADAGGEKRLGVAEDQWRCHRLAHALGDHDRVALAVDVVAENREFVAAEASDRVAGPQDALKSRRHVDQQAVAGVVAQRVVDHLEAVQVEEEDRDGGQASLSAGERQLEAISRTGTASPRGVLDEQQPRCRQAPAGRRARERRSRAGEPQGVLAIAHDVVHAAASAAGSAAPGSVARNTLPPPSRGSTAMAPPWRSTIFLQIASPIPVPG